MIQYENGLGPGKRWMRKLKLLGQATSPADMGYISLKKLQFIHTVNGNESKTAQSHKKALLTIITSPECQR